MFGLMSPKLPAPLKAVMLFISYKYFSVVLLLLKAFPHANE